MSRTMFLVLAAAFLATAACGDEDETEAMTDRVVALADSIDDLATGIVDHYSVVMDLEDVTGINALEDANMTRVDGDLYWVEFWTAEMATCTDDDDAPPPIGDIDDLAIELRRVTATHALMMGMAGDLDTARSEEARYLIESHGLIGQMRVDQLAMEDTATAYACPLFGERPSVLPVAMERLE